VKTRRALEEAFFLSLCAAILVWKLLLPGFVGMASNGDFGKVIGALCIDGADHSANNFVFFQSEYLRGSEYCFPPPYYSSETGLAWVASSLARLLSDPVRFDIRWMGTIHSLLFLGFYSAVLVLLRPFRAVARVAMSLAALWIFADIGLVAYLNSFFTDTAAILGGLAVVVLAVQLSMASRIKFPLLVLFGASVLLFAGSKAQHALQGLAAVVFLLWLAVRQNETTVRLAVSSIGLIVLAAVIWIIATTPGSYTAQARFNLIFFYLLPHSKTPAQDLVELGLDPSDARYSGLTAYSPASPMNAKDTSWRTAFYARTSYGRVLTFYVRHPDRALAKLRSDLWNEAPNRRVVYLSNYRRQAGKPAGARDPRFGSWSALRTRLFRWWPAHVLLWLALALCAPFFCLKAPMSALARSLTWTISIGAAVAVAEFVSVSLADAIETDRHLLLFHVFTDATIFLAMLLVCALWSPRLAAHISAREHVAHPAATA